MRWLVGILLIPVPGIGLGLDAVRARLSEIAGKASGLFGFAAIHLETGEALGLSD